MNVLFENIENELLRSINGAKESLDIAVSWFTNKKLFDAVNHKAQTGVKVRLIILNDTTNNYRGGLDFEMLIQNGCQLFLCPGPTLMHHKYCIVDRKILITGSCNWTNNIETNDENILLLTDVNLIDSYFKNFELMTKKYVRVNSFHQSEDERVLVNSFLELNTAKIEIDNFDDKALLVVARKNEDKGFIILKYLSRKESPFGRIYDEPASNLKTRFVKMNRNEISKLEIGDFIVFPEQQEVSVSEYVDDNGKTHKVSWLRYPELKADSFFKKTS